MKYKSKLGVIPIKMGIKHDVTRSLSEFVDNPNIFLMLLAHFHDVAYDKMK